MLGRLRLTFGRRSTERIEQEVRDGNIEMANGSDQAKKREYTHSHYLNQLHHINLENVLNCLVERYKAGYFYTYAGPMLLSMNPCLPTASRQSITEITSAAPDDSSPSVYSIGDKCLKTLSILKMDSIVVVSGESGAGKTTATEQLLSYFLSHSRQDRNGLDHKIRESALILESLGNACTISNPNSSRFGRFIQLNYENENIIGAEIKTCLLQKHRVPQTDCRNFHIFYYIVSGLVENTFPISLLNSVASEDGLKNVLKLLPAHMLERSQETDSSELQSLLKSFKIMDMMDEFAKIVQIVTGIMLLLNTQFTSQANNNNDKPYFVPVNKECLRTLAQIFSISEDSLEGTLISRTIRAGGTARRCSVFRKQCESLAEIRSRLDSMATTLYNSLFSYILNRLNSELKSPPGNTKNSGTDDGSGDHVVKNLDTANRISLLDLYGFENLSRNHLEQLCINYANEKLQITTNRIVQTHMNEMRLTNTVPLNLMQLEKEGRERIYCIQQDIFSILDEACLLNREYSDSDIYQRLVVSTGSNNYIQTERLIDRSKTCPFTIRHYATAVKYEMKEMAKKNNDNIPMEYAELFATSEDPFIQSLLQYNAPNEDVSNKKRRQQRTVLHNFKAQVEGLISELEATNHEIYFIKCLRPNETLTRGQVNLETVKLQLVSAGIEDILAITSEGLPIRIPTRKFSDDFCSIERRYGSTLNGLFIKLDLGSTDAHCGTSKVFLSEFAFQFLQDLEQYIRNQSACKIQRAWKKFAAKQPKIITESKKEQAEDLPSYSALSPPSERAQPHPTAPGDMLVLMTAINLRHGVGIVTRGQIHKGPLKFHTRPTPLGFSTNASRSQGLNEIFDIMD